VAWATWHAGGRTAAGELCVALAVAECSTEAPLLLRSRACCTRSWCTRSWSRSSSSGWRTSWSRTSSRVAADLERGAVLRRQRHIHAVSVDAWIVALEAELAQTSVHCEIFFLVKSLSLKVWRSVM
jgi:hypothetical protein